MRLIWFQMQECQVVLRNRLCQSDHLLLSQPAVCQSDRLLLLLHPAVCHSDRLLLLLQLAVWQSDRLLLLLQLAVCHSDRLLLLMQPAVVNRWISSSVWYHLNRRPGPCHRHLHIRYVQNRYRMVPWRGWERTKAEKFVNHVWPT